jgi:hypothetical protein
MIKCTVSNGFYRIAWGEGELVGQGWTKDAAFKALKRNVESNLELLRGIKNLKIEDIEVDE